MEGMQAACLLSEAMAQTAEAMSGRSVCLIGAGIMGITTAYYLAKSGRCSDIVLLEEGEPAGGASGKAAGFLARDWHGAPTAVSGHGESPSAGQTSSTSPPLQSLGKLSYELHFRLADELDGAQRYGYRKVPSLSMNVRRGQGNRSSGQADPLTAWTDACNASSVDVLDREGTAQLHPEQFCHVLLEECKRAGVKLVRGRAEKVVRAGDGHTVQHSGGEITCDSVVLCTGPWSGTAANDLLGVNVDVKELAGHSVVLRPKQPLPALAIFASVVDVENRSTETPELFSRPDGTIYVAGENCEWTKGCFFPLLSSLLPRLPAGAPLPLGTALVQASDASLARLLAACKLISPLLDTSQAEVVKEALCYRPVTARGYPYLCQLPQRPGLFLTAGHGRPSAQGRERS